jgi:hypothetical protein
MELNGLKLPHLFVEAIREGILRRDVGSWELRDDFDAYDNPLESELGEVYEAIETIARETEALPRDFTPDGYYGEPSEWEDAPGYIPDIVDFSKIVCFGISGDGAPFCFDFRGDEHNPSIVWWADAYWRRVAPDFASFLKLFDLGKAA